MIGLVQLFAAGLFMAWFGVVLYTALSFARPPRRTYSSAVAKGRPGDPSELDRPAAFESFEVDGCGVWSIEGDDADGPVVVLTHGWSSSRIDSLVRFAAIRGEVSRVFAWDLPGHGESGGRCGLGTGEWRVLAAIVERVGGPVVLQGSSMGAGIVLEAASRLGSGVVRGVIVEAPYAMAATPARNMLLGAGLPWRWTLKPALFLSGLTLAKGPLWRGFDRRAMAATVGVPMLVVHGDADEVCPIEDGRAIAAAAPQAELVEIAGGTHNGLWLDESTRDRVAEVVVEFLEKVKGE